MESLGDRLKKAREQKGYTFDQISRETNIARRYLEALEAEDFSAFPGEPYLLGFLRNYGEYLGLPSQELISSYRTLKLQEQPIPVEQLLSKSKPSPLIYVAIAVVVVAALGVGAYFFFSRSGGAQTAEAPKRAPTEYQLASGFLEKRLYEGDSVLVSSGDDKYKITVESLGDAVTLGAPGGNVVFELGQQAPLDLNGDGNADLTVFVADLFKNEPSKGAALRLELSGKSAEAPLAAADEGAASVAEAGGAAAAPASSGAVVFTSGNPYPFTLQATFRGYCLFRWESDRKDREERYFHKAETLTMQAQNGIRLWLSNASAVKISAIGGGRTVDLELGAAGEVVVSDVKWIKDDDGRYKLVVQRLD